MHCDERSERVKEMKGLIDKLIGTPQAFSVELTSSNSIIVRCEGLSQESILGNYEKELQDFEEAAGAPMTSIQ